jgi:hypothetical protein
MEQWHRGRSGRLLAACVQQRCAWPSLPGALRRAAAAAHPHPGDSPLYKPLTCGGMITVPAGSVSIPVAPAAKAASMAPRPMSSASGKSSHPRCWFSLAGLPCLWGVEYDTVIRDAAETTRPAPERRGAAPALRQLTKALEKTS